MAEITLAELKPHIAKIAIKHPVTDEPTSLIFHLKMPESSQAFLNRAKKIAALKEDPDNTEYINLLCDVVVGWEDNGAISEPYSEQACKDVLFNSSNAFIVQQLLHEAMDKHNFYLTQKKQESNIGSGTLAYLPATPQNTASSPLSLKKRESKATD